MNPSKTLLAVVLAGLCAGSGLAAAAPSRSAARENFSAQAMWDLKRLGDPAISPDGKWVVLAVTQYSVEKNEPRTNLWLLPTKPGKARQLTTANGGDSSPRWSPDGKWIAFVGRRPSEHGDAAVRDYDPDSRESGQPVPKESSREASRESQIYVIPFDGGEARRITDVPTGASAPKWFPDSRRIAFISQVWPELKDWSAIAKRVQERSAAKMTAKVWERAPVAYWDHYLDDRQTHLYWVDMDAGGNAVNGEKAGPHPITAATGHPLDVAEPDENSYDISPDGAEIAYASDSDATGVDPNFDIYVVPADGGTARNLTADNPANDYAPLYSPDGKQIAFLRQRIKDFYADKARLMLLGRGAEGPRDLTEGWDRSVQGLVWSPESNALFGSIEDAGTSRIYRFDVTGGQPHPLTRESSFTGLALAGSGPTIVALRQSFAEPPTLVSVIARTGAATPLSDFNDAALAKLAMGRFESVVIKGANGDDIQSWVVYPPNFTPDRKWPLYLLIHGGPHNAMTNGVQWRWNAQVFASWGYVTAWYNFHGSSGFGQEFTDSISREPADLPYQDTLKVAQWFQAQPWIDSERLAAGGGSFGGYLATVLLGRPHPFKTLIAHAAVFDSYAQTATDDGAVKHRFGEFWADPARMQRNSPNLAAANFNTPTLIIHGQQDLRVPVNNGIELFNVLQNRGVPSKLVYFPDENHWILKPQNSLFWYETVRQWLERYVKPGPGA